MTVPDTRETTHIVEQSQRGWWICLCEFEVFTISAQGHRCCCFTPLGFTPTLTGSLEEEEPQQESTKQEYGSDAKDAEVCKKRLEF